jgi:hypothetical protein
MRSFILFLLCLLPLNGRTQNQDNQNTLFPQLINPQGMSGGVTGGPLLPGFGDGSGTGELFFGGGMSGGIGGGFSPVATNQSEGLNLSGSSSLNTNCKPNNDFACGECETKLQDDFNSLIADITGNPSNGNHWSEDFKGNATIKPGVTLEDTLAKIKKMMKDQNPDGDNGLNYIVIGESESLQPSAVRDGKMYPRIALKSPSSELWVTFSTDPENEAYSTLEIMRWNGKAAKFEFMELDFAPNKRHMDGTGEKCLSCHKQPDPRPNWDTYRAWSGVVPSRDDMLEMHTENGEFVEGADAKMGTDGRAYLSFLEQVVDAKENKPNDRLALLDVPIDEKVQFAGREPKVSSLTPREQLEAIKKQTEETGFYRIPHYPYKEELRQQNFDGKTAEYTGPSQAAFDQMSGQNFCRISQRMKEHPDYDKFKYFLAGVAEGCNGASRNIADPDYPWIPDSYKTRILNHYKQNPRVSLRNLALAGKNVDVENFQSLETKLVEDTEENHKLANVFKVNRHERFLQQYLGDVEKQNRELVEKEARNFSSSIEAPMQYGFHAIDDFGGVNGVPEDAARPISSLRAVLNPLGIDVTQWSMMRGDDPDYNSLAFSDQFSLLYQQAAVREVLAEIRSKPSYNGDMCGTLRDLSYTSLADPIYPEDVEVLANEYDIESWCRDRIEAESFGESLSFSDNMKDIFEIGRRTIEEDAKDLTKRCASCHGQNGFFPFPGLDKMTPSRDWSDEAWSEFNSFLRAETSRRNDPASLKFIEKLEIASMPPSGWGVGNTPDEIRQEDRRRRMLLNDYVKLTAATTDSDDAIKSYCRGILNTTGSSIGGDLEDESQGLGEGATQQ